MAEDNARSVIEALLFASEKPLTLDQIKKALDDLDTAEIKRLIDELKMEYEQSNRGMRIIGCRRVADDHPCRVRALSKKDVQGPPGGKVIQAGT